MINHDVGNNLGTFVIRPFKAYSLTAELYFSISLYLLNLVQTSADSIYTKGAILENFIRAEFYTSLIAL